MRWSTEAIFDGHAPVLHEICDKITEISGLETTAIEPPPELRGDTADVHGRIAFARFPNQQVQLVAHQAERVKRFIETHAWARQPFVGVMQGANQAPGTQTLCLSGVVGFDLTLMNVTRLAVKALGGQLQEPLDDVDRKEFARRIDIQELDRRHEAARRKGNTALLFVLILFPVLVLWQILGTTWLLCSLPWRIWKAWPRLHSYFSVR